MNAYVDASAQFKAGTAYALCEMAGIIGKDYTSQKVLPILMELLKDDNSEVKLNVVENLNKIAKVLGPDLLTAQFITSLSNMTKDAQWRVRYSVFELIGNLGVFFGKDIFQKHLQAPFMWYLDNTAASVRTIGIEMSKLLANNFPQDWILTEYIPFVINKYSADKKGYNYRMCCLNSLAAVMPFTPKDAIT